MSKDSHPNNLRLMGSPVNLSYRSKKKDDKKNLRNRPRSALQNTGYNPESQERLRRPFSADANKEHVPSTRTFLKTFSAELLQSYNNSPNNIKVLPPTNDLLEDKFYQVKTENRDREICSNASDHGSEDTFISLGTKIKARAQSPKAKNSNTKNFIKYRNIARKGRKLMDNNMNTSEPKAVSSLYALEIKITDKRENSPVRNKNLFEQRSFSPMSKQPSYDSYFLSLDQENKVNEDSLVGRVSFGNGALHSEVEQAIDTYNRRSTLTKHQLSLVEEESTQDVESVPSHNLSSLSPEHSLEEPRNSKIVTKGEDSGRNSYSFDPKDTKANDIPGPRTYRSFYDDFQTGSTQQYKMSSTLVHTDASSKDSGYTDSGHNDEKPYRRGYSLPCKASLFKKSMTKVTKEQPKSLECIPLRPASAESFRSVADKKSHCSEPLNHSRLLYKDFFLKKEGHIATAPQNSPRKSDTNNSGNIPGSSESIPAKTSNEEKTLDYPSYLLNSGTKAYTSKVIEDYKKEIQAINNLHELTLKDLKTDSISPTPLNIDKLFEQHSILFDDNSEQSHESVPNTVPEEPISNGDNSLQKNNNKKDISEVSTQELIENYLKVKDEDYNNDNFTKNLKKLEKKISNITNGECSLASNQFLNNKNFPKSILTKTLPVHIKNQTHKSVLSVKTPVSARIDSVQNDKDIESWMSLSAPSPRVLENNNCVSAPNIRISEPIDTMPNTAKIVTNKEKDKESPASDSTATENLPQSKELKSDATVLDIYSMLKEIESFGEKPVAVPNEEIISARTNEDRRPATPKDNFMEIFQFLENVEQSANDALSVVTTTTPQNIPKLEVLLKLPQTELAQRLVTSSLQLEERSCCIALLQESLANHKEQMVNKVNNLEKQSMRSVARVKLECEDAVKRHQAFIDQLINDKKTLNHRIEQLVDERRALEERWRRSAHALEERYKLQLSNQRDKMAAAQQVARQRWVRQKAEKIKELTVKGLEGELREMAERQQSEIADIKMAHAETIGRLQSRHAGDLDQLRTSLEQDRDAAVLKERQVASARMEKQILELELTYQEQRTRLVAEMRAENERVASGLSERERCQRREIEKWREDQERILTEKKEQVEQKIAEEKEKLEEDMKRQREELEAEFDKYKREFEATQRLTLKQRESEIAAQYRRERDREIEKAIESMDCEAQAGRKDLQEALRRNKEQYELELKALAETEQATLRRYQDAQARVRQTEDKCAELEVSINQLQTRNRILTEKTLDLEQRSEEIRSSCEAAWAGKVEALRKDLEDQKKVHEEQMHQLYAKVKVAVARKDSAIQALTRESAKHQEKAALLEQKLQQQRKDFFKK